MLDKMGGKEKMVPAEDYTAPPWIGVHPNYCEWPILHDAPQPMLMVLDQGQAEVSVNGHKHPMALKMIIQVSGTVLIHNTNPADQGIPPGQDPDTTVYYKHLI
jgi:hypothetical protein